MSTRAAEYGGFNSQWDEEKFAEVSQQRLLPSVHSDIVDMCDATLRFAGSVTLRSSSLRGRLPDNAPRLLKEYTRLVTLASGFGWKLRRNIAL